MNAPTPNFKPNSVVTITLDCGHRLTLIVTKVIKGQDGVKFSGYDLTNRSDYRNIAYNEETAKKIRINLEAQEALPKPGAFVIRVDGDKTLRGVIKSIRRGKFDVLYEGMGTTSAEKLGHISVVSRPFQDASDEKSVMAPWSVSSYREFSRNSQETVCLNASLSRGGRIRLHVTNDGNGGCDTITPAVHGTRADMDDFLKNCQQWAADYGDGYKALEPHSDWLGWEQLYRPFGRSEADYFKELKDYAAQMRDGL
ncbi:hypothetical protein [Acetobacter persici]|uniref:Uncharacterized protein n=1 Tax=Acetobacter persici TaxID=1076596 RepID=A0A1U9LJB2_9PROT|nr:hypothetical protein [Acetobacter persici]AQT06545.1 hypothetical protein A0U91_16185 [Acetobacter persici]